MNYVLAKLHRPAKGDDWYVYYSFRNQDGEMQLFKERRGINRIKNLKERKEAGNKLAAKINKSILEDDWSPLIREDEDPNKENKKNFYWWTDQRQKQAKGKTGYYNTRKITTAYNKLKEFAPTLTVKQFDRKFIHDFELHLIKDGCAKNYIAEIFTRIKMITTEMVDSGYIPHHKNPFLKLSFETTRVIKERLNSEEIEKLRKVDLRSSKEERMARDMYLLSYFSAGIRFGDLCRLKPEMFKLRRLRYEMHKSKGKKKHRNIIMTTKAYNVYRKYLKGEYLFDLGIDWENEDRSIGAANSIMNGHLKAACRAAGIPEVTFHTSRNSFADLAVKKKVPTRDLQEAYGHGSEKSTRTYMADFYPEETDGTIKKMFGE